MSNNFKFSLDNGKYEYIYEDGKQTVLRYGEDWRDISGDNFIFALAWEFNEYKTMIERLINANCN